MSPKTLWTILLKIMGFYVFLQLLFLLPNLFAAVIVLNKFRSEAWTQIAFWSFSVSIYLFLSAGLIFRTDWVITALRLNKGIKEEKLELNIHRSVVLQIAIIVIGGTLIIESLPLLLKEVFTYFQVSNVYNGFKQYQQGGWIIFHFIDLLIGYFMVSSSRLIVNFIERKRKVQ